MFHETKGGAVPALSYLLSGPQSHWAGFVFSTHTTNNNIFSTHQTYAKVKSTGLINFRNSYPNEANLGAINASRVVLLWNAFGFWLQKLFGKKNDTGTQVFDAPPISLTNKDKQVPFLAVKSKATLEEMRKLSLAVLVLK